MKEGIYMENIELLESYKNNDISLFKEDYFTKVFKENSYSVKDLEKIDRAFQNILDECIVYDKSRTTDGMSDVSLKINQTLDKNLTDIEKIIKKVFNIDLKIKIDTNTKRLEYFACIFITNEDIRKVKNDIKEIIEDEKFGLHYIKVKKAEVLIQDKALFYIKKYDDEGTLCGRHLTAILLHELGHKIYLKLAYNKNADGEYLLTINDSREKRLTVTEKNKSKKLTELAVMAISAILVWLAYSVLDFFLRVFNTKEYVRIESYSDRLAIQYGYGKEIYQFFLSIEMYFKGRITHDKNSIFIKLFDADYLRRKEMKANIIKEINDTRNTKYQVDRLKEVLKFIEEIEKDAEEGNNRYKLTKKQNLF